MDSEVQAAQSSKILVTYATRYGSTREVAESVGATLRDAGLLVDVVPVEAVRDTLAYRAIVLGAPLYIGSLQRDAQRFLQAHRASLEQRPVAIFALGPIGHDEQEQIETRGQLDQELEKYPWLKPITVEMFGGKYDPKTLSFTHRLLTMLPASPLHGLPASDKRDWTAINNWAKELAQSFQPETQG